MLKIVATHLIANFYNSLVLISFVLGLENLLEHYSQLLDDECIHIQCQQIKNLTTNSFAHLS